MSDNILADKVKRRLILFLRIPAEVWTDILKLFPRRTLIQKISPVCYRLKEISDKNVKTVHVIEKTIQFTDKLKEDNPEAIKQLEQLAGNDCQLASQFKLTEVQISEKSQAILRHCPDLVDICQISMDIKGNKSSTPFLECLSYLEKAKPVVIYVRQRLDQVVDFWRHPTFQNCSRVRLVFLRNLPDATLSAATMMNIFEWLHQQPTGMDCNDAADQQVRGMIVLSIRSYHMDLLINRCSEDIQQAQQPSNRHSYVLNIYCWDWPGFGQFRQIENKTTGELLVLDRMIYANGLSSNCYRLRRCLAEEEANGPDFYSGMFKRDEGYDEFKIDNGLTRVTIG